MRVMRVVRALRSIRVMRLLRFVSSLRRVDGDGTGWMEDALGWMKVDGTILTTVRVGTVCSNHNPPVVWSGQPNLPGQSLPFWLRKRTFRIRHDRWSFGPVAPLPVLPVLPVLTCLRRG